MVFGISPAMLNLSRNIFSKVYHESILFVFNEVNQVYAFSDKVLRKALHNTASLVVTSLMAKLYLQIYSWGFVLPVYKINCGNFKLVSGRTSWIHLTKGPISNTFFNISLSVHVEEAYFCSVVV